MKGRPNTKTPALYALNPPRQYQAGLAGGEPIYFDCCRCGTTAPEIHAYVGFGPRFDDICTIYHGTGPFWQKVLLCEKCHKAVYAQMTNGECPDVLRHGTTWPQPGINELDQGQERTS